MTEDQAIKRISRALIYRVGQGGTDELDHATIEDCATLAWNEIKAIAAEIRLTSRRDSRLEAIIKDRAGQPVGPVPLGGQHILRPNDAGTAWVQEVKLGP